MNDWIFLSAHCGFGGGDVRYVDVYGYGFVTGAGYGSGLAAVGGDYGCD